MGIKGLYLEHTGKMAKEAHRKYNRLKKTVDDSRAGDVLNRFGIETDPFEEELR